MSRSEGVPLRVISGAEVRKLLPVEACIPLVREAMKEVSQGHATLPLRHGMAVPGGMLGMMYGSMAEPAGFGVKLVSLFPGNRDFGLSTHMGLIALYEPIHGRPVALMDASTVTAIRTAAASAVATDALARPDASVLALLGTGEQAAFHLPAMGAVRPFREVRVWGRSPEKTAAFARRHGISACGTVEAAVAGADVVCTLTSAREPILEGEVIAPGTHLNVVGSSIPDTAEIDAALVAKARVFCDYRTSFHAQAGEFLRAVKASAVTEDHLQGEIGEVLLGSLPGRRGAMEITLYKSLGVFAQDLAAATAIWQRAEAQGAGVTTSL